jgi:hypothetical protein
MTANKSLETTRVNVGKIRADTVHIPVTKRVFGFVARVSAQAVSCHLGPAPS